MKQPQQTVRLEVKGLTKAQKARFKVICAKEDVTYAEWILKRLSTGTPRQAN